MQPLFQILCVQCFRPFLWLSHSLVEFGRGRGCPFRKVERSALLLFSSFPPRNLPPWSFLTSLPNLFQARGELHFRSPCKSSLRIYCALLPIAIAVRSKASYRYSMRSSLPSFCACHTLFKPAPVTGRTSTSKTGNAQLHWAYPSFLQCFRPLLWLSHSFLVLRVDPAATVAFDEVFGGFGAFSHSGVVRKGRGIKLWPGILNGVGDPPLFFELVPGGK